MRSSKDVLPGEDPALYEQRRLGAMRDLAPRNDTEKALVERHVRLEWRGMRGEAVENARAARRIHEAEEGAENRDAAEVARLGATLTECPENRGLLLRSPAGVRFLIEQWSILHQRVKSGKSLLGSQRKRCLALLGKRREDALHDDPVASRWLRALLGAMFGANANVKDVAGALGVRPPDGMHPTEFDIRIGELAQSLPTRAEALALLVDDVAEEIRRLEEHLQVVEPLTARDRALDAEAARMEVTPEGTRLGQQVLASYRGSDATLRRLNVLQNPPCRGPGRGAKKGEPSAAAPAPAPEPPAAPTPTNPAPTPAMTPNTAEAIATPEEVAGNKLPVSQVGCLGWLPAGQAPSGSAAAGVWGLAGRRPASTPGTPGSVSTSVSDCLPVPQTDEAISTPYAAEPDSQPRADEAISTPHAAEPDSQPRADEAISTPNTVAVSSADAASADNPEPYAAEDARLSMLRQQLEAIYGSRRTTDDQASGAVAPAGRVSPADAISRPPPSAFESREASRAPPEEDTS
jgi:hypothetical protein